MNGGNVNFNLLTGTGHLGPSYVKMINKLFNAHVTENDTLQSIYDKISNCNNAEQELLLDALNMFGPKDELTDDEWLSNEHIDKLISGANLFVWKGYDKSQPDLYTIDAPAGKINDDVDLDFSKYECMKMIKPCRYYTLSRKYNSNEDICDHCYSLFPVYYLGCSGSDAFFHDLVYNRRLQLPEISTIAKFMKRYPEARIFAIVNLVGFSENQPGEHWVTLYFKNGVCTYYCSCGGEFDQLHFHKRIMDEFNANGIKLSPYESKDIQADNYNCGIFSVFTVLYNLLNIRPNNVQSKIDNDGLVGKFINTRQ